MFTIGEIDPGAAFAAFVGPVVAVGITLWLQGRDRSRDRKELLLRQMVATRLNPADPVFNVAIALIPVEFRHEQTVLTAHKDFLAGAGRTAERPTPLQDAEMGRLQEALILAMLEVLGFKTANARDVVRNPYSSVASANLAKVQQEALLAVPRLADAVERTATSNEELLAHLRGGNPPEGEPTARTKAKR